MRKRSAVPIIVLMALVAMAAPILLAVYSANRQGRRSEMNRARMYARDALTRTELTGEQIETGINRLVAEHDSDPCSPQSVALMESIDLASSHIQAIGHVSGNRLECSSLSDPHAGFDLGPPDFIQSRGARVREHVSFPFAPGVSFIVIESQGFAAVVHKSLPLDVTTSEADVSLAAAVGKD